MAEAGSTPRAAGQAPAADAILGLQVGVAPGQFSAGCGDRDGVGRGKGEIRMQIADFEIARYSAR